LNIIAGLCCDWDGLWLSGKHVILDRFWTTNH